MLERAVQYAKAVSDLPVDFFAPFSKYAATGFEFILSQVVRVSGHIADFPK